MIFNVICLQKTFNNGNRSTSFPHTFSFTLCGYLLRRHVTCGNWGQFLVFFYRWVKSFFECSINNISCTSISQTTMTQIPCFSRNVFVVPSLRFENNSSQMVWTVFIGRLSVGAIKVQLYYLTSIQKLSLNMTDCWPHY